MYLRTKDNHEIKILYGTERDWEDAMAMAWRTFSRFVAPLYSVEGCESFIDFISSQTLKRMFTLGRYRMFIAKDEKEIVGFISIREKNHISLLFVDPEYQGMGIGRALISCAEDYLYERDTLPLDNEEDMISDILYERGGGCFMTVFAVPNAVGFYEKLGFRQCGDEENSDGMIYVPMVKGEYVQ